MSAYAADQNPAALFNDGTDTACTAVTDNAGVSARTSSTCSLSLGNPGAASGLGMGGPDNPNLVSNSNGLFVYAGLEVFGSGVASGAPIAYFHGGISLFSQGTTSGNPNKLIGLAAGNVSRTSTDGINGSQLFSLADSVSGVIGGNSTVNSNGTISAPSYALTQANSINGTSGAATNIGSAFSSVDTALGKLDSEITEISNTSNNATRYFHANSTLTDSAATGKDSVAIGGNATASAANSVALGANAKTTANMSAPAYNPGSATLAGTAPVGEVSAGSAGNERRLTNVAAGSAPTDAVNVSQLMAEDAKVNTQGTSIANVIGGGATYNASTGTITGPTFNMGGSTITTIADAINNIDGRVIQNTTDISNITNQIDNGEIGLVQQNATTRAITVAKDTNGTSVDFTGTAGARKLTGVASGTVSASSTDAVNGSQLFKTAQSTADALGGGSTVNSDGTVSAPSYVINGGNSTFNNVGDALTNVDGRVTQNTADITTINNTLNDITGGGGVTYFHANSTAADSKAEGADSIAIGGAALALGMNAIAMGSGAQANAVNSMALGAGSVAAATNAVALGQGSVADRANSVSVGSAGNERQITNVAAGTAATDAVNVAQLEAVENKVDQVDQSSVKYDTNPDGTTNYSSVTMGGDNAPEGTVIHNVAAGTAGTDAVNVDQMNAAIATATNEALDNVVDPMFSANGNRDTEGAVATGTHATAMGANANASGAQSVATGNNAQASGVNSVAMGANAKATADHAVALGDGSVADRANTVSVGAAGSERQIANVAAGTATTDAVNVGQLNSSIAAAVGDLPAGTTAKQYTDQQINMVQQGVNDVARNAYSGIAAATALTMIPDVDPGKTIAVGIGTGSYQGYQAAALGASARITPNIKVKLGAGISAQGTTFGAGASYQW